MFPLCAALVLPAALSLAGCGLEQIVVLEGPTSIDLGSSTFGFTSTDANELEFEGYDIYYKLFVSSATPSSSYNSYEDMVAAGYYRLQNPSGASSPLVFVDDEDKDEVFTVTLDFSGLIAPGDFPKLTAAGASLQPATTQLISSVRRPFERTSNVYKRFTVSELLSSDSDVKYDPAIYTEIQDSQQTGVACFALSFGLTDDKDKIYSVPVFLGGKTIRFPLTE